MKLIVEKREKETTHQKQTNKSHSNLESNRCHGKSGVFRGHKGRLASLIKTDLTDMVLF